MPVNSFDDYPMSWKPDLSRITDPLYLGLVRQMEEDIQKGVLKAGTKLPPQRELADFLDLNVSTISRAFKLCEQKGLLSASVGNGTYVSADVSSETILICEQEHSQLIEMGALVPQIENCRKVKDYMQQMLKRPDALHLFSYQYLEGTERQRDAGVKWIGKTGFHTDREHILLAAGGQNGILAVLGAVFVNGDKIGCDPMIYPGVKTAAKLLGIQLIPIAQDQFEISEAGIRFAIQNENIKGIYVIPDFHNPTSHIMSLASRKMIASIAQETNIVIIEDGINHLLTETPLPPIASFAPEHVIYISSLSKTIAAGLRTAFLHVPHRHHQALASTLYVMNISVSCLLATVSAGLIEDGIADEIITERKQELRKRNQLIDELLQGRVLDSEPTSPLRYIPLPDPFTGEGFEQQAKKSGVQVYGAERFTVGNKPVEKFVRISVITPKAIEELKRGIECIKEILCQ